MLALGIGASVAIFAFVDAALIKPLPYKDPTRLVDVNERAKMFPRSNLSYQDYVDWKKMNKVFSALEVYGGSGYLMSTPSGVEPVQAARVSAGFFRVLGVTPALGRDFYDGEDQPGAGDTVMLTYATWQARFGGRKDIIGQTVKLRWHAEHDHWSAAGEFSVRSARQGGVLGDGAYADQLREETKLPQSFRCGAVEGRRHGADGAGGYDVRSRSSLRCSIRDSNRGQGASVMPLYEEIVGDIRPILLVLLGGAGLLLVIACVNVSSLLLVRSESAEARDCGARCAGSFAGAAGAPVHHGGAGAGDRRRSAGAVVRLWGDAGADAADLEGHAGVYAVSGGIRLEYARGGVCGGDLAAGGGAVCGDSCAAAAAGCRCVRD